MDVVVSWPTTVDVSSVIMVTQCRTLSQGISVSPLLVVKEQMRLVVVTLVAGLVTEIVAGLEAIAATIVWLCG